MGGFAKSLVLRTETPSGKVIEPMFPLEDAYGTCVRHPGKTLMGVGAVAFLPVYQGVLPIASGILSFLNSGRDCVNSFASKKLSGPEKAFYGSIALLSLISSAWGAIEEGGKIYCSGDECSGEVQAYTSGTGVQAYTSGTEVQIYCSGDEYSREVPINPCPLPEGSYKDSCNGTATYIPSSDPHVGGYCMYDGQCLPRVPGQPLVDNQFFYAAGNPPLQDLDNNNGIILSAGTSLTSSPSTASSQDLDSQTVQPPNNYCEGINGSFSKTCQVTAENYETSDEVARKLGVPLCEVHTSCVNVDGEEVVHSQVILNEQRIGLPVENCDGHLVQHPSGQDKMCQNADGSIARKFGETSNIGTVLSRTKLLPSE